MVAVASVSWAGLGPAEILERSRVLAVVGCSRRPWKAAHEVPEALQRRGFRIIPVHLTADEILGERVYRTLADVGQPIDTDAPATTPPYGRAAHGPTSDAAGHGPSSGPRLRRAHRTATIVAPRSATVTTGQPTVGSGAA